MAGRQHSTLDLATSSKDSKNHNTLHTCTQVKHCNIHQVISS